MQVGVVDDPGPCHAAQIPPEVEPVRMHRLAERGDPGRREPVDLEHLRVVEVAEADAVPARCHEQVARRVRELVQDDERRLAAVRDEQLLVVLADGRRAEEAAVLLVRRLDVLEAPGRPQLLGQKKRL